VLRPGIDRLVETDLAAIDLVCRWLKLFRYVRDRMDIDRLVTEFTATTRNELDLVKERGNLERFAADFKDDPRVYVPRSYNRYSTARALTLENVAFIKIGDGQGIEAWGIERPMVAEKLYDIYMKQIFVTNFVHVDPHPGNLFVKPMPTHEEMAKGVAEFAVDDPVSWETDRPFQIVFIDFGMTAEISDQMKSAMQMGAIGIGTQDARKVIQAYVIAGMLQAGADLRRLEEAHENWFQRVWGVRMGKMQETVFKEVRHFLQEYRDLISDTPFQFPADLLFIGRAIGILAGMSTNIDPEFDPWTQTIPYAKRFAREELMADWQGWPEEAALLGRHLLRIPGQLDQVLSKARQGSLSVLVSLSPETRKAIRRIDLSVKRFSWMVLAAGLLVSGVNLHIAGKDETLSLVLLVLAGITFLWGMRKW
jgi:predicted unusual protein kinase regulating ubiquinone biosynthesis (AarF/ABC1/UbiB family)